MIRFKATEQQIKEMGAKAVNASSPMGLGSLHFNSASEFKPGDFKVPLHADYVQGRMVKLDIQKTDIDGVWQSWSFPPRSDYQSWAAKYPDNSLLELVGAEVVAND